MLTIRTLLPAQVLGPVQVAARRWPGRRNVAAVGRMRDVAVLGAVNRKAPVGSVHPLHPVDSALEVPSRGNGAMSGSREVSIVGGWLNGYGWSARPAGVEQSRVVAGNARAGGARRASHRPCRRARAKGDRPSRRSTECGGTAAAWSGRTGLADPGDAYGSRARSARRGANSPTRIVSRAVAARPERVPGLPDQAAVRAGRHRHGRAFDRLRPQVLAEVRLVPDRPEAHARQRRGLPGGT